jgi:hypothetical protein
LSLHFQAFAGNIVLFEILAVWLIILSGSKTTMSPDLLLFIGLCIAALVMGETPLKRPFKWAETYYHELSHGIACLLTGGRVRRIELNLDGSGMCTTAGGSRFFILIMGYAGASLWGVALYLAGHALGDDGSLGWLQMEVALLAITTLLWVRDIVTLFIVLVLGALYSLPLFSVEVAGLHYLLQYMGVYVMMNAIRAPLYLIDGRHVGDGAALADLTFVFREWFWIAFWWIFACGCLFGAAYLTLPEVKAFTDTWI